MYAVVAMFISLIQVLNLSFLRDIGILLVDDFCHIVERKCNFKI
jgi:hypothetical protein